MSQLTRMPRQQLRWTPEDVQGGQAAQEASAARRAHHRAPAKKKLPLGTMALVGGLSVGAVGGLAVLSGGLDLLPAVQTADPMSAAKAPPATIDFGSALNAGMETKSSALSAGMETKSKASESAIASALPAPRPVPIEPIKTASISPAVPIPATPAIAALAPPKTPESVAKAPEPEQKASKPAAASPASEARLRPTLSAAEAGAYLTKAETALRNGDLVVARSFFGRLAQSGDPRGALGMARTYDEAELKTLPVYGLKPDRAEAERWRVRAREMTNSIARN
jgi:hypothetical protein